MSDPKMIKEIMEAVSIPVSSPFVSVLSFRSEPSLTVYHRQVMAKSRIGHIVEAQILQAIGVDYIDE